MRYYEILKCVFMQNINRLWIFTLSQTLLNQINNNLKFIIFTSKIKIISLKNDFKALGIFSVFNF